MGAGHARVAIVVDSAASLPANADQDAQLYIAPMQLVIEGRTYADGRDMTPDEFYRRLETMSEPASTASPSPETFLEVFKAASENASRVLCITVSPRFSSSYDAAATAARLAKETLPRLEIALLDSESAAGGEGLVVTEALRVAKRGDTLEVVAQAARRVARNVSLLAFLDTLYFVWRSGRVRRLEYAGASLLKLKPMLELSRGEVRGVARPRTRPRATLRLLKMMRQRAGSEPIHACVVHGGCLADAEELMRTVESEFNCDELYVSQFSPVMGAHTGPGLLGVAFWTEASV